MYRRYVVPFYQVLVPKVLKVRIVIRKVGSFIEFPVTDGPISQSVTGAAWARELSNMEACMFRKGARRCRVCTFEVPPQATLNW